MTFRTYTIKWGSTERNLLIAATSPDGSPRSGIDPTSPGTRAGFVRDDGTKGAITLQPTTAGEWKPGGLVEIDPGLAPGVYQFGVPDAVLAPGATRAAVVLQAEGARFEPLDLELVAFDSQDPERIGMEALAFESRVRCLTTAFPLLAVEEQKRLVERESAG